MKKLIQIGGHMYGRYIQNMPKFGKKFLRGALPFVVLVYVTTMIMILWIIATYDVGFTSEFPNLTTNSSNETLKRTPSDDLNYKRTFDISAKKELSNITILMWTKYYNNRDLVDHIKSESPVPDWCHVTFDRAKLGVSRAVVFHITGQDLDLHDLPPRTPLQPWVFFIIEPPIYMARNPVPLNGLFDRSMSYRLDSDYPCPYGFVTKRKVPLLRNPYYHDPSFPRNKEKLVAWMVSHCTTTRH